MTQPSKPRRAFAFAIALLGLTSVLAAAGEGALPDPPLQFLRSLSGPIERNPHTTLLAGYDRSDSADADWARANPGAAGIRIQPGVPGIRGQAVACYGYGAHLSYNGAGNAGREQGTVTFWAKSRPGVNIWKDGRDHYLFALRYGRRVYTLMKKGRGPRKGNRDLFWFWQKNDWRRDDQAITTLPAAGLDPDAWHHFVVSWDRPADRLWLAVDGKLATGKYWNPDRTLRPTHTILVGGGWSHHHAQNPTEAIIDEFRILDLSLPRLYVALSARKALDPKTRMKAQDAVRSYLDFCRKLQVRGGWPGVHYIWPTLIPTHTPARGYQYPSDVYHPVHGYGGGHNAMGMIYLYSYQVTGDERDLMTAVAAGDFTLAMQLESGCWLGKYIADGMSVKPYYGDGTKGSAILQDGYQSQATMFLAYLWHVTGEERFRRGALKAVAFLRRAQNPNGSWSHHFNLAKGYGESAQGHRGGGEFNDECMQTQMNCMLLGYHLTGDSGYLDAVRRAGDWIVAAQLPPPTFGWADQYDAENRPARARHFEPPACAMRACYYAVRLLLMMWDLTGDSKYLAPARRWWRWYDDEAARSKVGDRLKPFAEYHWKNGRPIAGYDGKIFYLDDADTHDILRKTYPALAEIHAGYRTWPPETFEKYRDDFQAAFRKKRRRKAVFLDRGSFQNTDPETTKETLNEICTQQSRQGPWLPDRSRLDRAPISWAGLSFRLTDSRVVALLTELRNNRIAAGEIDLPVRRNDSVIQYLWERPTMSWLDITNVPMD
jgi:hypothetical protein